MRGHVAVRVPDRRHFFGHALAVLDRCCGLPQIIILQLICQDIDVYLFVYVCACMCECLNVLTNRTHRTNSISQYASACAFDVHVYVYVCINEVVLCVSKFAFYFQRRSWDPVTTITKVNTSNISFCDITTDMFQ